MSKIVIFKLADIWRLGYPPLKKNKEETVYAYGY